MCGDVAATGKQRLISSKIITHHSVSLPAWIDIRSPCASRSVEFLVYLVEVSEDVLTGVTSTCCKFLEVKLLLEFMSECNARWPSTNDYGVDTAHLELRRTFR
jgi:hypothetical protein